MRTHDLSVSYEKIVSVAEIETAMYAIVGYVDIPPFRCAIARFLQKNFVPSMPGVVRAIFERTSHKHRADIG